MVSRIYSPLPLVGKADDWVSMSKKISSLQALRGLAAASVVGFHSIGVAQRFDGYADHPVIDILKNGWIGLDIFFVLSGYLIGKVTFHLGGWNDAVFYLKHRLARIVPAYWMLTLLMALIILTYPQLSGAMDLTFPWLLSSLFFFPYFSDGRQSPLLFIGWTLNYEMLFYCFVFFGVIFRAKWFASAVISILGLWGAFCIGVDQYWTFFTNPIMLEFAAGFVLFYLSRRMNNASHLIFAFGMLTCCGAIAFLLSAEIINEANRAVLGLPIAGLILLLINAPQASFLKGKEKGLAFSFFGKSVTVIGDASYSIYLIQAFTLPACYRILNIVHLSWLDSWVICLLVIGITISSGLFFFWFIEKPILKILRPQDDTRTLA